MKRISILGSTGSIGRQALQVVDDFSNELIPVAFAAGRNKELLLEQVKKYRPRVASLEKAEDARWLRGQLPDHTTEIYYGQEGLQAVAVCSEADTLLAAVSGAAGLLPVVAAVKSGKSIALANKETLVAAGELVMGLVREYQVSILPVDSEHSAIWQCLQGQPEEARAAVKIHLTASGGPFRSLAKESLELVTPKEALKHPNWQMGAKITIDSASMMNKGLEVIEARWLFDIDYEQINVVIHPQSIIHSMVEFADGSVLAQLGVPNMRLPIQYALLYPRRLSGNESHLQWPVADLTFAEPDPVKFPALGLAFQAGRVGKTMPTVLNAANEIAVHAFLAEKISFTAITAIVAKVMEEHTPFACDSLEEIICADLWARRRAEEIIYYKG